MEREQELLILSGVLCFAGEWVAAGALRRPPVATASHAQERHLWWRLWSPVLAAGLIFAFVIGWASQEPDPTDEPVARFWIVAATVGGLVVLRAALRGLRSARPAGLWAWRPAMC